MNHRWILACAAAESIGMTAAAGSAWAGENMAPASALAFVVAGGLVEGAALGLLQSRVVRSALGVRGGAWAWITIVVAGLGWAVGSAPSVLSDEWPQQSPALPLILLGAAAIGIALGPLLGFAQAMTVRRQVSHPWRWVLANTVAWPLTMAVIMTGASTAGADWPLLMLLPYAAVTGLVAGAVLGLVSGLWLPTLSGPLLRHRFVLGWLALRRSGARDGLAALRVVGRRTGRSYEFPVMTAPFDADSVVVLPGRPDQKTWWRNLGAEPQKVAVLDRGRWFEADARLVEVGTEDRVEAAAAYSRRWPGAEPGLGPLVVVTFSGAPALQPSAPRSR